MSGNDRRKLLQCTGKATVLGILGSPVIATASATSKSSDVTGNSPDIEKLISTNKYEILSVNDGQVERLYKLYKGGEREGSIDYLRFPAGAVDAQTVANAFTKPTIALDSETVAEGDVEKLASQSPVELVNRYSEGKGQLDSTCSVHGNYGNHRYKWLAVDLTTAGNVLSSSTVSGLMFTLAEWTGISVLSGGTGLAVSVIVAAVTALTADNFTIGFQDTDEGYGTISTVDVKVGAGYSPNVSSHDDLQYVGEVTGHLEKSNDFGHDPKYA